MLCAISIKLPDETFCCEVKAIACKNIPSGVDSSSVGIRTSIRRL